MKKVSNKLPGIANCFDTINELNHEKNMNTEIKHYPEKNRFEVHIDEFVGYVEYEKSAAVIDYTHTIVPRELGGRGLGTDLVKYALAYARVEHFKVIPTCSFVAALMDKHVIYQDLRVK